MGSSKKHKEKDRHRDKDEKRDKSHKKKRSKDKGKDSDSEDTGVPADLSKTIGSDGERRHKRKHKERKRNTSSSEDSDAPTLKSAKRSEKEKSVRGNCASEPPSSPIPTTRSETDTKEISVEKVSKNETEKKRLKRPHKQDQRSPTPPPKSSGGGGDSSLSIEETNKLRLKLGLKPLQIEPRSQPPPQKASTFPTFEDAEDESTVQRIKDEREKEGEVFWKEKLDFVHAPAENISQQRKADKIREKIQTQKEKRRLEQKLLTKGLADSDSDDDAEKWVEKTKRLAEQKVLAAKRAKALSDLDDEFGVGDLVASEFQKLKSDSYKAKDLKGMKVMHDSDRINEGESVIMTLDDKGVLDDKEDVLVNVNMIDDEKFEKNIKDRKMRPDLHGYNVFDELGGFDEHGLPQEKKILSKYDEEIEGQKKSTFVLGEDNSFEARQAQAMEKKKLTSKILETIQAPSLTIGSDFFSPQEMTAFKKTKKKVRKVRKALRADDLLKDTATGPLVADREKNLGSRRKKEKNEDDGKEDTKEDMKPMKMEIDIELDDLPPMSEIDVTGIKIEDEGDLDFQLALSKARKAKQKKNFAKPSIEKIAEMVRLSGDGRESASGSITLHATAEFCRTLGDIPSYEGGDIYGDEKMDFETEEQQNYAAEMEERGKWNEVEIDETPVDITREPEMEKVPILEEEPEVGTGIAGALKLAMKKGYLEQEKRKPSAPARMKHLQAKHYSIEDKNYEEERSAHHKRDMYAGPLTEFKDKDHYKPEVKLEYTDEDGQTISAKEAFRLLSHKFHGKGSGKNKIDKKRRKLEQAKLMQHMNSTDTPLGTLELLQERQKQSHTPYIVLSGNKAGQSSALTKISKR